jgi:hypothetical protein
MGAYSEGRQYSRGVEATGSLRSAPYAGTRLSILDPQERERCGLGYELDKELVRQLGIAFEPIVYPKMPNVQDGEPAVIWNGRVRYDGIGKR